MTDHTIYLAVVIGGCLALALATFAVVGHELLKLHRLRAERVRLAADLEDAIAEAMALLDAYQNTPIPYAPTDGDFAMWEQQLQGVPGE